MSLLYVVEVQTQSLIADVLLNGVRVFRELAGARKTLQSKLNPWVVEGTNQVQVLLAPGWAGTQAPSGRDEPAFQLVLMKAVVRDGRPTDEQLLTAYRWNPASAPLTHGTLRIVFDTVVEIDEAFGRWRWQSAPARAPSDDDVTDIVALLHELHTVLAARDADTATRLVSLKLDEMSRALDIPRREAESKQRAYFDGLFAAPDWAMAPLDVANLVLEPQAGGRLVALTDAQGGPPLRGRAHGEAFAMNVTLTKAGGFWTVVR